MSRVVAAETNGSVAAIALELMDRRSVASLHDEAEMIVAAHQRKTVAICGNELKAGTSIWHRKHCRFDRRVCCGAAFSDNRGSRSITRQREVQQRYHVAAADVVQIALIELTVWPVLEQPKEAMNAPARLFLRNPATPREAGVGARYGWGCGA